MKTRTASPRWTLTLVSAALLLQSVPSIAEIVSVEPDDFPTVGFVLNTAIPGVFLSVVGSGVASGEYAADVVVVATPSATTGTHLFGNRQLGIHTQGWCQVSHTFRADFDAPTRYVSIDMRGRSNVIGALQAFGADGQLLEEFLSAPLATLDTFQGATISRPSADIHYVLIGAVRNYDNSCSNVRLDNFKFEGVDAGDLLNALYTDVVGLGPGKSLENTAALAQTYFAASDVQATCAAMRFFDFEVRVIWRLSMVTRRPAPWKLTTEQMDDLLGQSGNIQLAIGCN